MEVTLVIPVYNEEAQLASSLTRLRAVLAGLPAWRWDVVIADNGSTDSTWRLAQELARRGEARVVRLARKGRGAALSLVWCTSTADLLAYTDVDLSTDPAHLPELLEPLASGAADLAIGSRLVPTATVRRGLRREVLSRGYNHLARWITGSRTRDHQCGFKALTSDAVTDLLPEIRNRHWFFDTELLVLAQRRGWRIREVGVRWTDDPDSRVRILPTIWEDLRGLWRLRRWAPAEPEAPCGDFT